MALGYVGVIFQGDREIVLESIKTIVMHLNLQHLN